jgi:hypothetical protein
MVDDTPLGSRLLGPLENAWLLSKLEIEMEGKP